MDNYGIVVEYFKNAEKPLNAGAIVEATGVERKEVDKIMKQLKKEELIVSPKNCYWEYKK